MAVFALDGGEISFRSQNPEYPDVEPTTSVRQSDGGCGPRPPPRVVVVMPALNGRPRPSRTSWKLSTETSIDEDSPGEDKFVGQHRRAGRRAQPSSFFFFFLVIGTRTMSGSGGNQKDLATSTPPARPRHRRDAETPTGSYAASLIPPDLIRPISPSRGGRTS